MSDRDNFLRLRIAQAYTRLVCLPENAHGARTVMLKRKGNCEIRIFETSPTSSADAPLFWMELFDHDGQSSVDSCCCHAIEEAVTAFEAFLSRARGSDQCLPPEGSHPQS